MLLRSPYSHRLGVTLLLGSLLFGSLSGVEKNQTVAQAIRSDVNQRPVVLLDGGDDVAIMAAIGKLPSGGGVVDLGLGTFTINHPIVIDRDGIELRGQGNSTVLMLGAKANCPVLIIGSARTPTHRLVRQIVVQDLLIDGNREEQQFECYGGNCDDAKGTVIRNNAITIRGAEHIGIKNVVTRRARSGGVVLEKYCRQIRIEGLESYDNEFDGLAGYETEDSHFTGLNLHHNRSAGFSFDWRFNRNVIADTTASDNGSQGIFMRDSIGNTFERVILRANGEQGIFMAETRSIPGTACRYNRFLSVTITDNKAHGIRINDASCTVNTLDNCIVTGNGTEDISLADMGQLEITHTGQAAGIVSSLPLATVSKP